MAQKTSWTGAPLTETDINTYLMGEGGAWSTWTPTVQQGVGVSVTVGHATWGRWGRLIIASFRLSVTSAGTAGQGVGVSLPVNAARTAGPVGTGGVFDSSVNLVYAGIAELNAVNNQLVFTAAGVGVSPSPLGVAGFTAGLASGDVISGVLTYEAAT